MYKKQISKLQSSHAGFTLLELMVTVVILAILAAIAMPMYSNYITKAKARNAGADLVTLSLVLESLYQRNLIYPSSNGEQEASAYLTSKGITGIWQPAETETFEYKVNVTDTSYTLIATGKGRNTNCQLTINNKNDRSIPKTYGCGGLTSW